MPNGVFISFSPCIEQVGVLQISCILMFKTLICFGL